MACQHIHCYGGPSCDSVKRHGCIEVTELHFLSKKVIATQPSL